MVYPIGAGCAMIESTETCTSGSLIHPHGCIGRAIDDKESRGLVHELMKGGISDHPSCWPIRVMRLKLSPYIKTSTKSLGLILFLLDVFPLVRYNACAFG